MLAGDNVFNVARNKFVHVHTAVHVLSSEMVRVRPCQIVIL